jgi:hypothetical protein
VGTELRKVWAGGKGPNPENKNDSMGRKGGKGGTRENNSDPILFVSRGVVPQKLV